MINDACVELDEYLLGDCDNGENNMDEERMEEGKDNDINVDQDMGMCVTRCRDRHRSNREELLTTDRGQVLSLHASPCFHAGTHVYITPRLFGRHQKCM
jgi:hypothetical protein